MKASETIKSLCCGQGLPLDCNKLELAKKVATMENEIVLLNNQLKNALVEIERLNKN